MGEGGGGEDTQAKAAILHGVLLCRGYAVV